MQTYLAPGITCFLVTSLVLTQNGYHAVPSRPHTHTHAHAHAHTHKQPQDAGEKGAHYAVGHLALFQVCFVVENGGCGSSPVSIASLWRIERSRPGEPGTQRRALLCESQHAGATKTSFSASWVLDFSGKQHQDMCGPYAWVRFRVVGLISVVVWIVLGAVSRDPCALCCDCLYIYI